MAASTCPEYDTIVIGAGMSGLACASRLLESDHYSGEDKLLVLEGRNRIGGRIGAVHVNGNRLDTGANWIHGIGTDDDPNPLVDILPHKKYRGLSGSVAFRRTAKSARGQAPSHPSTPGPDGDWVKVRNGGTESIESPGDESEDLIVPSGLSRVLSGALWRMIGGLHETANETPPAKAKSTTMLKAVIDSTHRRDAFKHVPTEYHSTLSCMPAGLEGIEAAPLVAQSAEHLEDQPGMSLLEYALDDFEGDQVFLQDGYLAVIDEIAKDLVASNMINLGTHVKQIRWDSNPIEIITDSGQYRAKQVDKNLAITNLGFGTLDKIFMVYNEPWWLNDPYLAIFEKGLVGSATVEARLNDEGEIEGLDTITGFTDELTGIEIQEDGTVAAGPRMLFIVNLHNLTGFPALQCFVSCANAAHVETLGDRDAGGIVHRALNKWLGVEPPNPDAVHVTRWAQDEYSRGSYSHMITGLSEVKHREAFQEPIVNKNGGILRFAGEHTSRNHFATVHGALLSGWREANDILSKT
ncbi:hypothetical protein LTR78_006767 [Recurvomyces mirabilis]|uniref:Amine oxidase domain-containing protein n=1 Tax=Recurvomyces mirabilis TaxID=574656 RepID=A0AAE1BZB2_9PEZI|nr:hypothetical protein LTR78_006767 [Recurvomyces mirabilis]KAK5153244.1 hypothetical protein LTS14_007889 [Recurvomyces mirabilis]